MKTRRKSRFNIFWKTFIITTAMLLGITLIAFTLIYQLLPGFYQTHKINAYTEVVENRIYELKQADDLETEVAIWDEIFLDSNTLFSLFDSNGEVLFELKNENTHTVYVDDKVEYTDTSLLYSRENEVEDDGYFITERSDGTRSERWRIENEVIEPDSVELHENVGELRFHLGPVDVLIFENVENSISSKDENYIQFLTKPTPIFAFSMIRSINFDDTFLNINFNYENGVGEQRLIEISIPLTPLADAQVVIMSMYPFAIALSIVFALIFAFTLSRWIANPIKKIQDATSKMSRLEPNVTIAIKSKDEIGVLSQDVIHLYEQLRGSIVTLEQEVSRYANAENRKIEFLQSVSHEMKTPLASANALIEGIIYEVSPYHENQKHYLGECRDFLQKTIQLTKESLKISQEYKESEVEIGLKNLVKETSNLYRVIFMSKQLSYSENVPGNVHIKAKVNLLSKVLSNLYSNVANYTASDGKVRVWYEAGWLSISNTCEPLAGVKIEEIFKPLMTQNTSDHATGLGLFIVKQLLRQMKITYSFEALPDKSGMIFKLKLPVIAEELSNESNEY